MNDDELKALEIKLELAKLKYTFRTTLAASVIGPVLLALLQWLLARQAAEDLKTQAAKVEKTTVAVAADVKHTAAAKAAEIKTELAATTERHDEKLNELASKTDAIGSGVDASVRGWKAYQTKDPNDMNVAVEAVAKAEKMIDPK